MLPTADGYLQRINGASGTRARRRCSTQCRYAFLPRGYLRYSEAMSIPHLPCVSEERSIYPLDSATAHREVWRCLSMLSSGGRNVAAAHLRLELALIALLSVTLRLKALALCPSRGALRLTRTTCPIGNVHGWHGRKLLSSGESCRGLNTNILFL